MNAFLKRLQLFRDWKKGNYEGKYLGDHLDNEVVKCKKGYCRISGWFHSDQPPYNWAQIIQRCRSLLRKWLNKFESFWNDINKQYSGL